MVPEAEPKVSCPATVVVGVVKRPVELLMESPFTAETVELSKKKVRLPGVY